MSAPTAIGNGATAGVAIAPPHERIGEALVAGDFAAALAVAEAAGAELRERQARGTLPPPDELRQWHDAYQGLLGHVQALREDARRELSRLHGRRNAVRAYAHG